MNPFGLFSIGMAVAAAGVASLSEQKWPTDSIISRTHRLIDGAASGACDVYLGAYVLSSVANQLSEFLEFKRSYCKTSL